MPGHRVHRLGLAAVALGCAGVDEHPGTGQFARPPRVEDAACRRAGREVAAVLGRLVALGERPPSGQPGPQSTVEQRHLRVPEVSEQPPGAGGGEAVGVVVDDHRALGAHAGGAHRPLEVLRGGERVTPPVARRSSEIAVQVHEHRAGDVPGGIQVGLGAGRQLPADVEKRSGWAGRRGPRPG